MIFINPAIYIENRIDRKESCLTEAVNLKKMQHNFSVAT